MSILESGSQMIGLPKNKLLKYGFIGLILFVVFSISQVILTDLLGVAYPLLMSFHALESNDVSENRNWLTYWVVFGLLKLIDQFTSLFIPYYYVIKLATLIWLFHPISQGTIWVYKNYINQCDDISIDDIENQVMPKQDEEKILERKRQIISQEVKQFWVLLSNDLNRDKILETQTILNSAVIKTETIKRGFAFRLSEKDFDKRGDMNSFSQAVFQRGPQGRTEYYTQPSKDWYRIGLRVDGKYPEPISKWLATDNNPGEWYVAYHGIRIPDNKVIHQVVSNIMKEGLIPGFCQGRQNEKCRKTGKTVGKGVYCTPNIETARSYTQNFQFYGGNHRLVLQCRVKPEAVRYSVQFDHWVINNPSDIRPYGILLYCEEPQKCRCNHRKV